MKKILGWLKYNENKEEKEEKNEECKTCECDPCECEEKDESFDDEFDFDTLSIEEKKKLPAALQAYIDKKKSKKGKKEDDKEDDKEEKSDKKLSPKQKKIAAMAEPKDKIDGKDFAALRKKK